MTAALCAVALVACTGTDGDQSPGADRNRSPARAQTAASAPGEPTSTPAVPFDLTVDTITMVGMSNAAIRGTAGPPADHGAAERAVAGARDVLAAFLDAQFVAEDTRFSAAPIDRLLSARALGTISQEGRAGLGQLALPVAHTVTGPASAQAHVLVHGGEVDAVTLTYDALLTIVGPDDSAAPATLSGAMTFIPTPEGWRADAVEATSDLPEVAS